MSMENVVNALLEPTKQMTWPNVSIQNTNQETETKPLSDQELEAIVAQQCATNYLCAAMIFLRDNPMLSKPLTKDHVKYRLLGHWGTCPGINMVYAHVNHVIKTTPDRDLFVVFGVGHGAPAALANYYIEGTLGHIYNDYTISKQGFDNLVTKFSTPSGFPSHTTPEIPSINEGSELGYSLSTSWGAVMDLPNTIIVTIIGDGENETGPSATAWHSSKYIDPKESGAVLPILHCNGFKIAERTIFGAMSDDELVALFTGYGYQPRIVSFNGDLNQVNLDLADAMTKSIATIKYIQEQARQGQPISKPRFPMIVLRTPKGWTGVRSLNHTLIEGTFRSHQVPLPNAKTNETEFQALKTWLDSYGHPSDLFDENGQPNNIIKSNIPSPSRRGGTNPRQYKAYTPMNVPEWEPCAIDIPTTWSRKTYSSTQVLGHYLAQVVQLNPNTFRIFSPDELESNKLTQVLQVTQRNFQWDKETAHNGGRVIEVLSEHQCQGFLQGYLLTGRHGMLATYEAFCQIISSMLVQYTKFAKVAREMAWRKPIASLNLLLTSGWETQSHNGFGHQVVQTINDVLNMKNSIVRVYIPADANTLVCTWAHCMRSTNYLNLVVASKYPTPVYLNPQQARLHCVAGISIWERYSDKDPDTVLACAGAEMTFETIVAARMLQKLGVKVQLVNVNDILVLAGPSRHPHGLHEKAFQTMFPPHIHTVFTSHTNPDAIKSLLYDHLNNKITVFGYMEEGTTTTPLRMMTINKTSRYDICIEALRQLPLCHPISNRSHLLISNWQHDIVSHNKYINEHGKDPDGSYDVSLLD